MKHSLFPTRGMEKAEHELVQGRPGNGGITFRGVCALTTLRLALTMQNVS